MKTSKIILISFITTLIGLFVLIWLTLSLSPGINNYFNRTEFDSLKWIYWEETENEPSLRWNMVHDLKKNYDLIGMSTNEIKELLGNPNRESKNFISYYLGMSGHGINTGTLYLELNNGKVIKVKIWQG